MITMRHWLTMAINDDGTVAADGFGVQVSQKLAMFHADDGLTASRDHNWPQHAMDALVALFGQWVCRRMWKRLRR